MRKIYWLVPILITLLVAFYSCKKEDDFTQDQVWLQFSSDTLNFDSVFTQYGNNRPISVTKQLRVTNPNSKSVRVSIRFNGNKYGVYKMNVDGQAVNGVLTDKEIPGKDSIIIFVQVYIQPGGINIPFVVNDQILFENNGLTQDVDLTTWAKDAHYFRNYKNDPFTDSLLTYKQITFKNDKPYLITDTLFVPSGCVLTIEAGCRIYSHTRSGIFVSGTLIINGSTNNQVVFEGDRLEPDYKDVPGQWLGIRFLTPSRDNVINNAVIKNAFIGITVDSLSQNTNPKLTLKQCQITNMTVAGIVGYTADLVAVNNLVSNCGQFTFLGAYGGNYNLIHNTFVTYNTVFNRQNPTSLFDNSPLLNENNTVIAAFPLNFNCTNNIIWGSNEDEVKLNITAEGNTTGKGTIQNCIIRTKEYATSLNLNNNLINQDPKFEKPNDANYRLLAESPAKGKGFFINISTDINDYTRQNPPSIGCYE